MTDNKSEPKTADELLAQVASSDARVIAVLEDEHGNPKNEAIEAKLLAEIRKQHPDAKLAITMEGVPVAENYSFQDEVSRYLKSGNIADYPVNINHLVKGSVDKGVDIFAAAYKNNATAFLIDDEAAREPVKQAMGNFMKAQAEYKAAAEGTNTQAQAATGEKLQALGSQFEQSVLDSVAPRSDIMAHRISELANGTLDEAAYKGLVPAGGFDVVVAVNGPAHFAGTNDMNEMIAGNLKKPVTTIELYSDKNAPAVTAHPQSYLTKNMEGHFGGDRPDYSINLAKYDITEVSTNAPPAATPVIKTASKDAVKK